MNLRKQKEGQTRQVKSPFMHLWPELAYMPRLNHWPDRTGPYIDIERSEVLNWLVQEYRCDLIEADKIFHSARSKGVIRYNPETRQWCGNERRPAMNSDDYAKSQSQRDVEYEREYKAWIESMSADERKKLEKPRGWPHPACNAMATALPNTTWPNHHAPATRPTSRLWSITTRMRPAPSVTMPSKSCAISLQI